MRARMRFGYLFLALFAVAACQSESETAPREESTPTQAANEARITDLMFKHKLGEIPEVQSKSREYRQMYSTGKMSKEQASAEFAGWLEDYLKKNPEVRQKMEAAAKARQDSLHEAPPASLQAPATADSAPAAGR